MSCIDLFLRIIGPSVVDVMCNVKLKLSNAIRLFGYYLVHIFGCELQCCNPNIVRTSLFACTFVHVSLQSIRPVVDDEPMWRL